MRLYQSCQTLHKIYKAPQSSQPSLLSFYCSGQRSLVRSSSSSSSSSFRPHPKFHSFPSPCLRKNWSWLTASEIAGAPVRVCPKRQAVPVCLSMVSIFTLCLGMLTGLGQAWHDVGGSFLFCQPLAVCKLSPGSLEVKPQAYEQGF